jgi:hypothetical protein
MAALQPEQPTTMTAGFARRSLAWGALALVAGLVVLVIVLWQAGFLLSNDGPSHLYASWALAHIDSPLVAPYVRENERITFYGVPLLYSFFEGFLDWRGAWRGVVILVALAYALGLAALLAAAHPRRAPLAVIAAPLALHHGLYLGLMQYELGVAIALFAVASWCRWRTGRVAHLVLALLITAAAMAHPFAAAIGGLACLALTLVESRAPSRIASLALAGLPAMAIALASRETLAGDASVASWPPLEVKLRLVVAHLPGIFLHGAVFWLVFVGLAVVVLMRRPRAADKTSAALLGVGLVLVGFSVFGPLDYAGWQLIGLRPLPFAAALLVAGAPFEVLGRRARGLAFAALAVAAATSFVITAGVQQRLARWSAPVVERIVRLQPEPAARGAIVAHGGPARFFDVPGWRPYHRIAQLSAVVTGGVSAYGFFGRSADVLALQPALGELVVPPQSLSIDVPPAGSPARPDWLRRNILGNIAIEHIVAFGSQEDLDAIVAAGFVPSQRIDSADDTPGVMLARFEGCEVGFSLPGPEAFVDAGAAPLSTPLFGVRVEDGAIIDGFPCGPVWLRFQGLACSEADEQGRVPLELARGIVADARCTPRD